MNPPYSIWVERWKAALEACERSSVGGQAQELVIMPPASLEAVAEVEAALGASLPPSFRTVLLEFSAHVEMAWFLPDDLNLWRSMPDGLSEVGSGGCSWNLSLLTQFEEERGAWAETNFPDLNDSYDAVWHDKLAFARSGEGDFLALDLASQTTAPVIYLSHEYGEAHGYRLGSNFIDFMERWSLLGCCGDGGWAMMPFLNDPTNGLDPHGENARLWRQWFGLNV